MTSDQKNLISLKEELKNILCDLFEHAFKIPFESFITEKKSFCILESIYLQNEMKITPDILEAYFKVLADKGMSEDNETIYVFQSFLQFGREIDVNNAFNIFKKFSEEKYGKNMENMRLAFFYAINELKFMGLINYKKKKKMMTLNKNFFAKNLFFDYNKK
jgi:hypothetical protein